MGYANAIATSTCEEGNAWVNEIKLACELAHGQEMGVSEWQQMDRCEKEALLEFRRDAEEEAAQVEGLPEADSELALEFMREEHRAERLSAGVGDCIFEAICNTEKDGRFGV